jgi:hypothetical protein
MAESRSGAAQVILTPFCSKDIQQVIYFLFFSLISDITKKERKQEGKRKKGRNKERNLSQ